jgi:hypothetical protein
VRAEFRVWVDRGDIVVLSDVAPGSLPSTVVSVVAGEVRVVREGAVARAAVEGAVSGLPITVV